MDKCGPAGIKVSYTIPGTYCLYIHDRNAI
jgi:hypothetical protein